MHTSSRHRSSPVRTPFVAAGVVALLATATVLDAHDFWLVPNGLSVAAGGQLEVLGQSGTRFPASDGPTQPAQVAEARIVGGASDERITDLSVGGKSLVLRHKPGSAGQYVVGVVLASRTARSTPAQLKSYIALEGAPELAARYEQEGRFAMRDSVTRVTAKYAKTIVEVGANGPRAFDKSLGHALEIVPLNDPARVRVGDSLRVRLLFHGKPVPNVHLRAGSAAAAAISGEVAAPARVGQVVVTDANGIAKVALAESGLWNVRTVYAEAMTGMPEHWEVFFTTAVFHVSDAAGGSGATDTDNSADGAPVASSAVTDSADVVDAAARFHAALAAGDTGTVLGLLSDDVAILESGGAETKAAYRAGHMNGDIEYAKALPSQRTVISVRVRGDAAWVTSSSITQGEFRGRQVNSAGAELMVLSREGGIWKIRAIHWSSRARRAP